MIEDKPGRPEPEFLVVGKIIRPHGVRGAVIVEPMSDCPSRFVRGSRILIDFRKAFKKDVTVVSSIPFKERLLVKFEEIETRDEAELYRGCELLIPSAKADVLREGEYWVHELVGMRVESEGGEKLGAVSDVVLGALQDHLVVADENGREFRVPFVMSFVREVDRENRRIVIRLIDGLK